MAPRKRALPKPLPEGFLLTDTEKKRWRLGKVIGQGGFGLIYLASQDVDRPVVADSDFVIKIEYHENGPLFSELKFYQRAAKPESMQRWTSERKLDFLGIPTYWGSGLAEHNGTRYRFMAMDRLGSDLQKACQHNGGRLKKATVLQLGRRLVDVLEYIHDNEYVHADIKAANLMLGHRDPDQVYLADYGLSYRYCPDGVHKPYKENPKKGHDGTIEYTSLDAHNGVAPSRRGDLQILGFCLLHWLCGDLPWDAVLKNPTQVQEAKARLMDNLPGSVQKLSQSGTSTDELAKFFQYVGSLGYQERPDYNRLRGLLASGAQGRIDLSRPHKGQTQGSTTSDEVLDAPGRGKKAGRQQGSSKPKAVAMEIDEDGPPITEPQSEQNTGKATAPVRRSARSKPAPVQVDEDSSDSEDDEEEEARPKPVDARYIRGPPVGPRRYIDTDEEEEEEEVDDEEDDNDDERPKPIDSRYIRGPPIGPRPQTKQANPRSPRPVRKTPDADLTVTSVRRPRPLRGNHAAANAGVRSQRLGEMIINHKISYCHSHWDERQAEFDYDPNGQWRGVDDHYGKPFCGPPRERQWDRYGFGECEGSPVEGSVMNAAPKQCQRDGWSVQLYCAWFFMGLVLFLVAAGAIR